MDLAFFYLWLATMFGAFALAAVTAVCGIALLTGWRSTLSRSAASRVAATLGGLAAVGVGCGVWAWISIPADDPYRLLATAPPTAFSVLALVALVELAVARRPRS